jgi:pimeloyl-ACP methyl ester carboxylesterase
VRRLALGALGLLAALLALPPLFYALFPEPAPALPSPGRRVPLAHGAALNALERGSGPAVVLVHGSPGSAYDWDPLGEALAARGRRVLAYDRLGYGHSDARPEGDFSVDSNARDLLELLEVERLADATVVGWSYGGATAIRAALVDPTRIGRLVLVGSAGPEDDPAEEPAFYAVLFSAPALGWMAAVPPASGAVQRALSEQAFSGQPWPAWWLPQLRANLAAPHTRTTFRLEGARFETAGLDPSPIERPILVIHGDDDRLAPLAIGEWLQRRARDARLVQIAGGSHMLPITHADLLADRIAAFSGAEPR